jgi:hypothetical protein
VSASACESPVSVRQTRIGAIELEAGLPATMRDADALFDASDFQRACQAYLWSLPLVGFATWQHSARTVFGMRDIDMVVYESLSDRLGLLTANPAVTYIVGLPDLSRTTPLIVDYPSGSSAGVIVDCWQQPITFLGEGGPDQGMGGRYLVVGPGQTVPANRANFVIHSPSVNVLVGFRALDADPARANALMERFCMYPHSYRTVAEPTAFLRPHGRAWSQVPPRGLAYWKRLADALRHESSAPQDLLMLSMLEPLGIGPTRSFAPTTRQRRLLEDAEQVGSHMAQAHAFYGRTQSRYRPQARWRDVSLPERAPNAAAINGLDERAAFFFMAAATSAGLLSRANHKELSCLGVYHDAAGRTFDGNRTYRLNVPAGPPAKEFWSLAIYDMEQRCLINNGRNVADRSSRDALGANEDGSIDLYVGPSVPRGRESNWIPTVPGRAWFAYFRLFEPLAPYFARDFALPDFVPLNDDR